MFWLYIIDGLLKATSWVSIKINRVMISASVGSSHRSWDELQWRSADDLSSGENFNGDDLHMTVNEPLTGHDFRPGDVIYGRVHANNQFGDGSAIATAQTHHGQCEPLGYRNRWANMVGSQEK